MERSNFFFPTRTWTTRCSSAGMGRCAGISAIIPARGDRHMRVLLVHPSPLMYSELYLRLEPLGLERVASAIRTAGHEVRLLDLQIFQHADYWRELETFAPQVIGFSVNYLANVPEVIDLAKDTKAKRRDVFIMVGGHSASFVATEF